MAGHASTGEAGPRADGLEVGGARFEVVIEGDGLAVSRTEVEYWVRGCAEDVAAYFGRFPVPNLKITVLAGGRRAIGLGQHWDGRFIKVRVGSRASPTSLARDWVLVHEMLHAAFPDLESKHKWMQEGLSSYLQGVVQARAGRMSDEQLWSRFVDGMEHGRPKLGDRGLDRTVTWGRLYWGGALFWLVADVRIREQTGNARSLQDALSGILDAGGDGRANWSTARVVQVGDAATGTTVLTDLYAEMALAPGDIDLAALWTRLGIREAADGGIEFDDDAELASTRRAITATR